jgi:hypothetical protein
MIDMNKKKDGERHPWILILTILTGLTAMFLFALVLFPPNKKAPAKKPAVPPPVVAKKAPPPPPRPVDELTEDDVYAAVFRNLRAEKACIDRSRNKLMVWFAADPKLKKGEYDHWHGWHILDMPTFHYLPGNDTWYLYEIPTKNFTEIWPNTKDHKCADAKDYDGK